MSDKEEDRRPFPQLNSFRPWTSAELKKRRTTWPTPITAPFVRMTSCNEDSFIGYKYFTLGLHGFDASNDTNLFDLTYGANRDIVGYAYKDGKKTLIDSTQIKYVTPNFKDFNDLAPDHPKRKAANQRVQQSQALQDQTTALGAHPIPGITSVQVKRSGLAAPLIAEVRWQCYNQQQLEFLRNHFLVVGSYIVLEWGHKYHDNKDRSSTILDFNSETIEDTLTEIVVRGRKEVIENFSEQNSGNYDIVVGTVGNFTVDIDPATNIYKCSTRIVSIGENIWGLSTQQTATVIESGKDPNNVNRISDIHSYFAQGAGFDQLLGKLEATSAGAKYVRPQQKAYGESAPTTNETAEVGANPKDTAFISWKGFTTDVVNDIIKMFDNVSTNPTTQEMYNKLKTELRVLLTLGDEPDINLSRPEIYDEQRKIYEKEWIGNHPELRSIDPNLLILITPKVAANSPAKEWLGNGLFGEDAPDETRAKLNKGLWISAGLIRDSFLRTTTLQAAIQQILNGMNIAVGGYWQLQLFYDDELSVYKIIDYKFDDAKKTLETPFYVFNSNQNEHHNEVLDIQFDSAFPPELISQMMVVSMIQTSTAEEQAKYFKDYPMINNTSPFMFAVNWTSLTDMLKKRVTARRKEFSAPLGTTTLTVSKGTKENETINLSQGNRTGDIGNIGPQTGNTPTDSASEGTPRTVIGSLPSTPKAEETPTAPAPRTTAKPPTNPDEFALTHNPLDSMRITSGFGARSAPTAGASVDHPGLDIAAPQGTPVKAAKSGTVIQSVPDARGLGGFIRVQHNDGHETWYGHLSQRHVEKGERVVGGQIIARSGGRPGTAGAGTSTAPHLHFEVRYNGVPKNPSDSLSKVGTQPARPDSLFDRSTAIIIPPAASDTTSGFKVSTPQQPPSKTEDPSAVQKALEYQKKFGDDIIKLIHPTASILRNTITKHGYENLSDTMINAFVSPFPTTTSVDVRIQGITGISISDGFMVDKLPFIFASYGVFQVTELTDSITDKGWYTNIRGYFKMIWPTGTGGLRDDL